MKTSTRWLLFLAGVVGLILCVHYFLVPLWASYPTIGWGSRHFRPRMFPWGSVVSLVAMLAGGFIWYKVLFPSPSPQLRKEEELCIYCNQKLPQSQPDSKKSPEPLSPSEGLKK